MTSPAPARFRIPGYDFTAPTEQDARDALARVFGPERAAQAWAQACQSAFVREGNVAQPEMDRVADALAAQGAAYAAVARSIKIRLRTHTRLAAKRAVFGIGDPA